MSLREAETAERDMDHALVIRLHYDSQNDLFNLEQVDWDYAREFTLVYPKDIPKIIFTLDKAYSMWMKNNGGQDL